MSKDLIMQKKNTWLKQRQNRIVPNHSEYIKFYRSSKYLSKPFEIFENFFKLFWSDIKKYPLKTLMKEEYFKVMMFSDCIKFLRADFNFYYTKTKNGKKYSYEINQEQYFELMESFRAYFFIPNLIIRVVEDKSDEVIELLNRNRKFPIDFMRRIKEIETTNKPKPKQDQAIIWANQEMKFYEESDLIDQYGFTTKLLEDIKNSYKAQKKNL